MSDKKRFLIRLSSSLRERLELIAEQEHRTLSDCMNHALTCYADKYEETNGIIQNVTLKKETGKKEMLQTRVDIVLSEKVKFLAKESHRSISGYLGNLLEKYIPIEEKSNSIMELSKKETGKKEMLQTGVDIVLAERTKVLAKENCKSVSGYLEIFLEKYVPIEEEREVR